MTSNPDERGDDQARAGADRRGFLKIGGLTVAFATVAAACKSSSKDQQPVTGTFPPSTVAGDETPASHETDITLLRTAQSIEVLAVQTYQQALDSGFVTTPNVVSMFQLFQLQHGQYAQFLANLTTQNGGQPYDQPNAWAKTNVADAAAKDMADEKTAVALVFSVENMAAQTYIYASEYFTTPELVQATMSIGGIEGRHLSVLYGFEGLPQSPFSQLPRRAAISKNGFITPDMSANDTATTVAN